MNKYLIDNLIDVCTEAQKTTEHIFELARQAISNLIIIDGKLSSEAIDAEQFAAHGFAWLATYVEGLRQILEWGTQLKISGKF